jgi:D-alanyl-lipoteichoic acid acyltransferase DltB (MBOAT superfamily)
VHRTYVNLMVTMLLGGLWHGASWNFVVWGGLHGLFLAIERVPAVARLLAGLDSAWGKALRWFVTFHLVCFAWIFFRSPDLATSLAVVAKIAGIVLAPPGWVEARGVLLAGLAFFAWQACASRARIKERLGEAHLPWTAAVSAACLLLVWFTPARTMPFIYFQF